MADRPPSEPDPDDDLDDEDDFEESYLGESRRMALGVRMFTVALLFAMAGLVVYLILNILYPDEFATPSWIGATAPKDREAGLAREQNLSAFALGGIRLGMTPEDARRLYPSLALTPAADGGQTGSFRHHDGDYSVSFHGPERGERAFRVRSAHAFATVSYLELLTELSEKYGKPATVGCGAGAAAAAIGCTLRWTLPDVRLEAAIRTAAPPDGGTARTVLVVTATDTRP